MISPYSIDKLTSKDLDELFMILGTRTLSATRGSNLGELFDNQQRFLAVYNEWEKLKTDLKNSNETEYFMYMQNMEQRLHGINDAVQLTGKSFDKQFTSVSDFWESQRAVYKHSFPFAIEEIVAWDSKNFIIRDDIYYGITGNRAVFFLSRID